MRIRQPVSTLQKIVWGIIFVLILVGGYCYLSYHQHVLHPDDTTIPRLWDFKTAILKIITPQGSLSPEIWLWVDAKATFSRLFLGMFWGCLLSLIIGLSMGCYEHVEAFFAPTFNFLSKIPPTAMLPIFFVLAGTGELMFTSMIAFGILPTLTQSIYLASKYDVSMEQINKVYTLGASNMEVMWSIIFRQILPKILDSVRLQIGPAMVYLIAAEFMMAEVGFGYRLRIQQRLLHMDTVYLYVVLLGLAGLLLNSLFVFARRVLCPWFERIK
jgi:NitT/TauT family transport system permease protein